MLTIREVIKTLYNALLQRLKKHRGNWEQNDPTADDYIKNRPFYTNGVKEKPLVKNYTGNKDIPRCNFIIGQAYNVIWNGKLYEDVICINYDGWNRLGDDSYPFYIDDDGGDSLYVGADNGTFSVSISIIQENIHKIDKKYLPDFAPVATSGSYNDLIDVPVDIVKYGSAQDLTITQQKQARLNISALEAKYTQGLKQLYCSNSLEELSNNNSITVNGFKYCLLDNSAPTVENFLSISGIRIRDNSLGHWENNLEISSIKIGTNCYEPVFGVMVVTGEDSLNCTIPLSSSSSTILHFTAPSSGIYLITHQSTSGQTDYCKNVNITIHSSIEYIDNLSLFSDDQIVKSVGINEQGALYTRKDNETITMLTEQSAQEYLNNNLNIINGATKGSLHGVEALSDSEQYQLGQNALALGYLSAASGSRAVATGWRTQAYGQDSHTEGSDTIALGSDSHAEGRNAVAVGYAAHAEGIGNFKTATIRGEANSLTYRINSYTGSFNVQPGDEVLVKVGYGTTPPYLRVTVNSIDSGYITFDRTLSSEYVNQATVYYQPYGAHGEGSHAEGWYTTAYGEGSHAEGRNTTARGNYSHAEGYYTDSFGRSANVIGEYNVIENTANYESYSAESTYPCNASETCYKLIGEPVFDEIAGLYHFESSIPITEGEIKAGDCFDVWRSSGIAHVNCYYVAKEDMTSTESQPLQVTYYMASSIALYRGDYVYVVGNGESNDSRSNAHTLDWQGNAWYSGDIYVGSTSGKDKDEGSKKLATEEYVNSIALPPVTAENNGAILQVIDGKWTAVQATTSVNETGGLTFNIGG